jgi:hypothetical protein
MAGRPHPTDAAEYYFRYIDQVNTDDIIAEMEHQLGEADELFAQISEEKSLYRYAPEKWSVRQVVNHISDAERTFAFRACWFARGFETPLPSFDQNIAAASARAEAIPWHAHVEEFRSVRMATLALYRNLPADAWERSGMASENRFTVGALAFIIAGHFTHHANVIRVRYLGSSSEM